MRYDCKTLLATFVNFSLPILAAINSIPTDEMGEASFKKIFHTNSPPALPILNGIICGSITFCFSYQLLQKEIYNFPRQWSLADTAGKSVITVISLFCLSISGILNSYFMIGHPIMKIIAFVVPAFSLKAIVTPWFFYTSLIVRSQYNEKIYNPALTACQLLDVLKNNLLYNTQISYDKIKNSLEKIREAPTEQEQRLKRYLEAVTDITSKREFVISSIARRYHSQPRKAHLLSLLSFLTFCAFSSYAIFSLFYQLAPKAGECVFSSGFQHYDVGDNIFCPHKSDLAGTIGFYLGHINNICYQNITVIFPMLQLRDIVWTAYKNKIETRIVVIGIIAVVFTLLRSFLTLYLSMKNNNFSKSLYITLVYSCYNFLSLTIYGPQTLRTFYKQLMAIKTEITNICKRTNDHQLLPTNVDDTPVEVVGAVLATIDEMKQFCLFKPTQVPEFQQLTQASEEGNSERDFKLTEYR